MLKRREESSSRACRSPATGAAKTAEKREELAATRADELDAEELVATDTGHGAAKTTTSAFESRILTFEDIPKTPLIEKGRCGPCHAMCHDTPHPAWWHPGFLSSLSKGTPLQSPSTSSWSYLQASLRVTLNYLSRLVHCKANPPPFHFPRMK